MEHKITGGSTTSRSRDLSVSVIMQVERLLHERGWKWVDLAEKLGCTPSYLSAIKKGDKSVNLKFLAACEQVFDAIVIIKIR